MPPRIVTVAERPDLEERLGEVGDPWPEFIHHDEVVNRHWPRLYEDFRELQLILYEEETDTLLGKGCTIPVAWDGRTENLSGGVVDVLESGGSGNVLCALVAVVDPAQQGRRLSGLIIEGMGHIAAVHDLECLIAPVRPTWKERYPANFARALHALDAGRRPPLRPVDPRAPPAWRRDPRRRAALARRPRKRGRVGGVDGDGLRRERRLRPGALVPVAVDRERDEGRYVEPKSGCATPSSAGSARPRTARAPAARRRRG